MFNELLNEKIKKLLIDFCTQKHAFIYEQYYEITKDKYFLISGIIKNNPLPLDIINEWEFLRHKDSIMVSSELMLGLTVFLLKEIGLENLKKLKSFNLALKGGFTKWYNMIEVFKNNVSQKEDRNYFFKHYKANLSQPTLNSILSVIENNCKTNQDYHECLFGFTTLHKDYINKKLNRSIYIEELVRTHCPDFLSQYSSILPTRSDNSRFFIEHTAEYKNISVSENFILAHYPIIIKGSFDSMNSCRILDGIISFINKPVNAKHFGLKSIFLNKGKTLLLTLQTSSGFSEQLLENFLAQCLLQASNLSKQHEFNEVKKIKRAMNYKTILNMMLLDKSLVHKSNYKKASKI